MYVGVGSGDGWDEGLNVSTAGALHGWTAQPSKMCEDAQDLSYFGKADGQCEKFSILNLHCRGLHAWVEIDQSHLLP